MRRNIVGDAPPDAIEPSIHNASRVPYMSAATVYHGTFLFFPAVFSHMVFASKPSSPNDGLLAGTLAVSRDGVTASWVDAPNGRDEFLPLGVNRCEDLQLGVYPPRTAWCANSDTMAASDFE